jgi:PPOX class probable F420-dependent enzyme
MVTIDPSTDYGSRVLRRLASEEIAWLTTVGPSGTPHPTPVWFLYQEDGTILIYSEPDKAKLRNIDRHPRASVNLNGDSYGGDIIVLTGAARYAPDAPPASDLPAYVAKYSRGLGSLGMTPEQFSQAYSAPILFTPDKLTGH